MSSHISCAFAVLIGGTFRMKDNSDTLPLLTNPKLPARYRRLPVVDIGANDGRDYTLPPALLGHRVYSFEPTAANYDLILRRIASNAPNVTHTTSLSGFASAAVGTIYLRRGVAVSNRTGTALFTETRRASGVSNSLNGPKALPRTARRSAVGTEVQLTTLDAVLHAAGESEGLFLLKIDAQGHVCRACIHMLLPRGSRVAALCDHTLYSTHATPPRTPPPARHPLVTSLCALSDISPTDTSLVGRNTTSFRGLGRISELTRCTTSYSSTTPRGCARGASIRSTCCACCNMSSAINASTCVAGPGRVGQALGLLSSLCARIQR